MAHVTGILGRARSDGQSDWVFRIEGENTGFATYAMVDGATNELRAVPNPFAANPPYWVMGTTDKKADWCKNNLTAGCVEESSDNLHNRITNPTNGLYPTIPSLKPENLNASLIELKKQEMGLAGVRDPGKIEAFVVDNKPYLAVPSSDHLGMKVFRIVPGYGSQKNMVGAGWVSDYSTAKALLDRRYEAPQDTTTILKLLADKGCWNGNEGAAHPGVTLIGNAFEQSGADDCAKKCLTHFANTMDLGYPLSNEDIAFLKTERKMPLNRGIGGAIPSLEGAKKAAEEVGGEALKGASKIAGDLTPSFKFLTGPIGICFMGLLAGGAALSALEQDKVPMFSMKYILAGIAGIAAVSTLASSLGGLAGHAGETIKNMGDKLTNFCQNNVNTGAVANLHARGQG